MVFAAETMAIAAALQGFALQARYDLTAGHKEMCF
jgi:hypothetical protein